LLRTYEQVTSETVVPPEKRGLIEPSSGFPSSGDRPGSSADRPDDDGDGTDDPSGESRGGPAHGDDSDRSPGSTGDTPAERSPTPEDPGVGCDTDTPEGGGDRQRSGGRQVTGDDSRRVGDRTEVEPDEGWYRLERGTYVVRYGEPVRIPSGHVGFVLPRSTLLRNGCTLDTAVWDAGYEGVGEGRLDVGHPIDVEAGARIAQLVVAHADHEGTYDGTYQGENR
jgi:hypothetical protein